MNDVISIRTTESSLTGCKLIPKWRTVTSDRVKKMSWIWNADVIKYLEPFLKSNRRIWKQQESSELSQRPFCSKAPAAEWSWSTPVGRWWRGASGGGWMGKLLWGVYTRPLSSHVFISDFLLFVGAEPCLSWCSSFRSSPLLCDHFNFSVTFSVFIL